jgi:hypothetical protein
MKNTFLFALTLPFLTSVTYAYEFSFYNNTETPIGIAIQFTGNDGNEPLYAQLVKPKERLPFTPGRIGIPDIKWGFCLDNLYYIENPTTEQKAHHFAKTPWKKIPITWVQEKSATKKATKTPAPPTTPALEKSLCRDRHFDIIKDEHGKIVITSSLSE